MADTSFDTRIAQLVNLNLELENFNSVPCAGVFGAARECQNEGLWMLVKPRCNHSLPRCQSCKDSLERYAAEQVAAGVPPVFICKPCTDDNGGMEDRIFWSEIRWDRIERSRS